MSFHYFDTVSICLYDHIHSQQIAYATEHTSPDKRTAPSLTSLAILHSSAASQILLSPLFTCTSLQGQDLVSLSFRRGWKLLSLRLTDSQVTYLTDWRPQRGRLLKRIVHGTSSDRHESQSQSFIKSIYRPNKCICANAQLTLFPKRSLNRLKDYSLVTDGVGPSFACNFLASEGKAIVSLHRRSVQFLLNGDDEASPLVDS